MTPHATLGLAPWLVGVLALTACSENDPTGSDGQGSPLDVACSIQESEIFVGQRRNGIPALTDPEMAMFGQPGTEAYDEDDRVVGVLLGDQPIAVPLNILWWHEIVNLERDGASLAITNCPLTGSSLVFDRASQNGVEFGVSGLLYRNNLMMYDRTEQGESFWPQMSRGARCGPQDGTALPMVAGTEMTVEGWRRLHPNSLYVTTNTGWIRDYSAQGYPYGQYDEPSNSELLFPVPGGLDPRHPPKERTLGIPSGTGGLAFAYRTLRALGSMAVVNEEVDGEPFVIFWDEGREGATAFRPAVDGTSLTFRVSEGQFEDTQTGSSWNMAGFGTAGPLAGARLEPVEDAFVAFWFAWPLFYPDIQSWSPS